MAALVHAALENVTAAATGSFDAGLDGSRVLAGGGEDGFTFEELYSSLVFLVLLWLSGRAVTLLNMPPLVGEILLGMILGPYAFQYVARVACWKLIGEIGLMILVIEAGLDVDLEMLKMIGPRGALIAVFGSVVPLAIGYGLAAGVMGLEMKAAFSVGASLAPTSMGIALNVLRSGKLLNTPTGQLVIAAAVLDDIIALVLLSELEALDNPTAWNFIQPILVALVLLVGFGLFAVFVMPKLLSKVIFPRVRKSQHGNVTLGLIFLLALGLAPLAKVAGSSYLLGCFICGMCFCTEEIVHHVWVDQVKRILSWLLRIFFACTIGFEIPVNAFGDPKVISNAFLLFVAIIGKLMTGFMAVPLTRFNGLVVAFCMSAWGEFAFIVITSARAKGAIDQDTMASAIFAILLSVIVSPILLRFTITYYSRKAKMEVESAGKANSGPVYYYCQTSSVGHWGQQDRILRSIVDLGLEIVDIRSFHHAHHHLGETRVLFEIFLKDNSIKLDAATYYSPSTEDDAKMEEKLSKLQGALLEALDDERADSRVSRWYPRTDMSSSPDGDAFSEHMDESAYHSMTVSRIPYSRGTAYADRRDSYGGIPLDGFVHRMSDAGTKPHDLQSQPLLASVKVVDEKEQLDINHNYSKSFGDLDSLELARRNSASGSAPQSAQSPQKRTRIETSFGSLEVYATTTSNNLTFSVDAQQVLSEPSSAATDSSEEPSSATSEESAAHPAGVTIDTV